MTLAYTSYESAAVSCGITMLRASETLVSLAVRADRSLNQFNDTVLLNDQVWWDQNTVTVTGSQPSPVGNEAYLITDASATETGSLSQTMRLEPGQYVIYVTAKQETSSVFYFKATTSAAASIGGASFDLASGRVHSDGCDDSSVTDLTGGFYKCAILVTVTTRDDITVSFYPAWCDNYAFPTPDVALTGGVYICYPSMTAGTSLTTLPTYTSVTYYGANDIIIESVGGIATQDSFKGLDGTARAANLFAGMVVVDPSSPATPNEIALHTYGYSGTLELGLHVWIDPYDAPAESLRRVRNTAGAIRSEIEAQFGSSGCFSRGTVRIGQVYILDETKYLKGYAFVPMTIDWTSP